MDKLKIDGHGDGENFMDGNGKGYESGSDRIYGNGNGTGQCHYNTNGGNGYGYGLEGNNYGTGYGSGIGEERPYGNPSER